MNKLPEGITLFPQDNKWVDFVVEGANHEELPPQIAYSLFQTYFMNSPNAKSEKYAGRLNYENPLLKAENETIESVLLTHSAQLAEFSQIAGYGLLVSLRKFYNSFEKPLQEETTQKGLKESLNAIVQAYINHYETVKRAIVGEEFIISPGTNLYKLAEIGVSSQGNPSELERMFNQF